LRKKHLPAQVRFRVVNAESDFLSGLIVDKYQDTLVLQITSLGMELRKSLVMGIAAAFLVHCLIVERTDVQQEIRRIGRGQMCLGS